MMIVLVSLEAAAPHGVLKKRWRLETGDIGLMHLRKSELPSCPHQPVLGCKKAAEFSFNGFHAVRLPHKLNAGREQKTSLDGSIDEDAVANRKHLGEDSCANSNGLAGVDSIKKADTTSGQSFRGI